MAQMGRMAGRVLGLLAAGAVLMTSWTAVARAELVSLRSDSLQPLLEVWKGRRQMEIRQGDVVLRRFRVALGGDPKLGKRIRGDGRTPVGQYFISEKNPRSSFRRFLNLSYPNIEDAERGYSDRLIDVDQWANIYLENLQFKTPNWRTLLGGRVGIHGYGNRPYSPEDWTEGCIAVSNEDIDFIYERVEIGTPVLIHE